MRADLGQGRCTDAKGGASQALCGQLRVPHANIYPTAKKVTVSSYKCGDGLSWDEWNTSA